MKKNKERNKSYKILAEIYNEEEQLVRYIIENKYGKIMDVKKEVLEQWD